MTKQQNSMFDIDLAKTMSEFKLPGLDVEGMMNAQRRNIEALTKANQLAMEGLQAIARRQAEIIRGGFENASSSLQELIHIGSPDERVAKNADAAKRTIETAIANARELAEIFSKAQNEAFDVLSRRVTEGLDEVKTFVRK